MSCACKTAKARYSGEQAAAPEERTEDKKEQAMPEKCEGCQREKMAGERFYRKQCSECRGKDRAEKATPSPLEGEGRGEGDKGPEKRMGGG